MGVMFRRYPCQRILLCAALALALLVSGCQYVEQARRIATRDSTPAPTATVPPPPEWQTPDAYRVAMQAAWADDVERVEGVPFYRIRARVELRDEPVITAAQDTLYRNRTGQTLDRVYFRLWPNKPSFGSYFAFQSLTIGGVEVQYSLEADNTAVGVVLPAPLAPDESVEIHMEYEASVPASNARGYGTYNYEHGMLLLSNFYATCAVYEDGSWNLSVAPDYGDPGYAETSFFDVEITLPRELTLVASGSTLGRTDNDDGTTTWRCRSGPMRDMMLAAGELESVSTAVGFVRLTSYFRPEHRKVGEEALAYARDCLRAYQQSFGPYPFAELDVVEAPIYAGGMEYPGMVLIAEQYYPAGGDQCEFIIAHEVAHQWWYSLVGNDQVNAPWLDESLTNFAIIYYYEHVYTGSWAETAFEAHVARAYRLARARGLDLAVGQPVEAFTPEEYGAIVYGKGALFFYELRNTLGRDVFLDVLRTYLDEFKYDIATGDDFLRVAEDVSGVELDDVYAEWILD